MITLTIDKNNIVTEIGGEWDEAAKAGHAQEALSKDKVIGKEIEHYLGSDTTQMYYDAIFKLCRLKNETIVRDYRCDSPTHERYMRMTIIPLKNNAIEMQHELIKEIPFKNDVNIEDMKNSKHMSYKYAKRCSICNRLLYPDSDVWHFPEELNQEKALNVKVIHTVCPKCKNKNWIN
jgi:hypothetical protein